MVTEVLLTPPIATVKKLDKVGHFLQIITTI